MVNQFVNSISDINLKNTLNFMLEENYKLRFNIDKSIEYLTTGYTSP